MNIVILTFSGIASFDYSLPLIHGLKKETKIDNVYLLSNTLNYSKFFWSFKDSRKILERMGIENIDLSSYSIFKYIKYIFKFNPRQHNRKNFIIKILSRIEKIIIGNLNLTIKTLEKIDADVVFFDHRNPNTIARYEDIFKYFKNKGIKVFLLPHAPHYLEKSEHLVTGLNKDILKHINYIEPFRYTKLDTEIKSDYKSVLKINYPGFELDWLSFISKHPVYTNSLVVLLRPFHTQNSEWQENEKVILTNNELEDIILSINLLLEKESFEKVIIKPHPKNFQHELDSFVTPFIKHKDIVYYHESIMNLISKSNSFISSYSTTLLTSIASGSPTYIINTVIFENIFMDWNILRNLYSNFTGFTKPSEIKNVKIDTQIDKLHLQKFFKPDQKLNLL